ncbi:MAG: CHAT domain-containing protein [Desulfobacterales bacterium]|nr:CHAT domain-containing protein [Desulfobacterales bacterium]
MGSAREIFISPDGNLNLIPFEVLRGPGSGSLIEDYNFNYLAAGRDLLAFNEIKGGSGPGPAHGRPGFRPGGAKRGVRLAKAGLERPEPRRPGPPVG